ncbi:YqaJ viral recombinase family protein, partial [Embleya sp. NPDC005971]|uniref:YqaJ viral recombinase family protein n=1 Tax=Embleya sp. NPDC005971 TaxID=3156724 RepID=UPI003405F8AA
MSLVAERLATPTGRLVLDADADRDTWLAARRLGIGSSDVPDILGVGDFGSPLRVYLDKVGELADDAGDPAFWGTVLEDPIAREWARRSRSVVEPIGIVEHHEHPRHRATL